MAYFQLQMTADGPDYPALHDVSTFLYDFNLLFELVTLAIEHEHDEDEASFRLGQAVWSREGRPLNEAQRLHVVRLREESPLELLAIVAALPATAAALWAFVQTLDKVVNWRLNREILELQREKIRRELRQDSLPADIWKTTERLGGSEALSETAKRLERSPLQIVSFDVAVLQHAPRKPRIHRDSPA